MTRLKFGVVWVLIFALMFPGPAAASQPDADALSRVLAHVDDRGRVDYQALQEDPADLERAIAGMSRISEEEFRAWPQADQIAYLINLYNLSTIDLIVQHYPVAGIRKIGNILKGPWDLRYVWLFGKRVTLNDLEHRILRRRYDEPRVHFALVCAARGCPALRQEPYEGPRLDDQLDAQGRRFFRDARKNRIDHERKIVYLSPIFKWFSGDFGDTEESILSFALPYFPSEARAGVTADRYKIRYTHYDWSLNGLGPRPAG